MKGKVVVVCGIVAVLGIMSAIAGFAAEATKVKASEVRIVHFTCVYPSRPAVALGIFAAVFAIINRIVLLIAVGCCGCRPSGTTSSPASNVFNILSWIASVIAVILFIVGANLNNREGGQVVSDNRITCYVVKSGIFAAGAVLSLLSAFFGIVAYTSIYSAMTTTSRLEFALPVASSADLERNASHPQQC